MQWSSATPGLLIILLDQSGSMMSKYDDNMTKSEFASKAVNRVINTLIQRNFDGDTTQSHPAAQTTASSTPSSSATSMAKAPKTAHSSPSSVMTITSTSCAPATSRTWTPSPSELTR